MGVATTIGIAAAASAASSMASAKMASNASKRAAETQARSAREAQGVAGQMFQQQQAMQSPYMQMGQGAAGMLGRLMGQPQVARFAAPPMAGMGWGAMAGGMGPKPMPGLPPPPGQVPPMVAPMGGSRVGPAPVAPNPRTGGWGAFMPPQGGGY